MPVDAERLCLERRKLDGSVERRLDESTGLKGSRMRDARLEIERREGLDVRAGPARARAGDARRDGAVIDAGIWQEHVVARVATAEAPRTTGCVRVWTHALVALGAASEIGLEIDRFDIDSSRDRAFDALAAIMIPRVVATGERRGAIQQIRPDPVLVAERVALSDDTRRRP